MYSKPALILPQLQTTDFRAAKMRSDAGVDLYLDT